MALASLLEIVDAMRDKLEAVMAASQFTVQVDAFRNLNPTPPSLDIYPGDPFSQQEMASFGDDGELIFTVRARIGTADSDAGQEFLLRLMDTEDDLSVANALQDDQTLNGTAGSVYVQGPSGHRVYEDAARAAALLGVDFKVTVLRGGS